MMTSRALRLCGLFGGALLVGALANAFPGRLIVNRTASIPLGLYWLSPDETVQRGSIALFPIPSNARELLDERRMIPRSKFFQSLSKPVVALAEDYVCLRDHSLWINERWFTNVPLADSLGRELPRLDFCRSLEPGELFVATTAPSFDSRYFGPVRTDEVRGTIRPLLTWGETHAGQ